MGPNTKHDRPASWYPEETDAPLPVDWFRRVPHFAEESQARVQRWSVRRDAAARGGPVLTVAELGSLIKQTEDAITTAGPGDSATLRVQLEDMKMEFHARTFCGEDETNWPRATVRGHVVT